jgi:hypothetical protein
MEHNKIRAWSLMGREWPPSVVGFARGVVVLCPPGDRAWWAVEWVNHAWRFQALDQPKPGGLRHASSAVTEYMPLHLSTYLSKNRTQSIAKSAHIKPNPSLHLSKVYFETCCVRRTVGGRGAGLHACKKRLACPHSDPLDWIGRL